MQTDKKLIWCYIVSIILVCLFTTLVIFTTTTVYTNASNKTQETLASYKILEQKTLDTLKRPAQVHSSKCECPLFKQDNIKGQLG